MKKGLFLLLFLAVSFVKLDAQTPSIPKYSEVKISSNFDSLEQTLISVNAKSDIYDLFNSIAVLEKSRLILGSCKFGESLILLDSINRIINTDNALQICTALKTFEKIKNFSEKSEIVNNFNRVLSLSKKLQDTALYAHTLYRLMVLNIMGEAYEDSPLGKANREIAKKYFSELIEVVKNTSSPNLKLIECIAKVEYSLNLDTSCALVLKNAFEGLAIVDKYFINNIDAKNYLYTCLSACYNYNSDFKNAIFYSKKCLELPKTECSTFWGHNYFNIANCYYNISEESDSALKYYSKAVDAINKVTPTNLLLLEYCYDRLAVIKYYKENYKAAFEDLYVRDSLSVIRIQKQKSKFALELQNKYEYEKNLEKISNLQNQKKTYLLVLIGVLIFLFFIIFLLIKNHKINNQLKQFGAFRDKLISIISHDLRSPFNALQGLNSEISYLIRNDKKDTLIDLANSIDETSLKISNLLNNLILWAKAGKIKSIKNKKISLQEVFTKTIELYNSMISEKQITIAMHFDKLHSVVGNKNVFELVIRNWLDNTIKYSQAKKIQINSIQEGEYFIISIIDDGKIDDNFVILINEQLQNNTSIPIKSDIGLGLELIAYFSKLENWKIKLETDSKNKFLIYIPVSKE